MENTFQNEQPNIPAQETMSEDTSMSYDTKQLITVICLLLLYPIGLILMFTWTKWPKWVKFLITLPVALIVLGIIAGIVIAVINPAGQMAKAKCQIYCTDTSSEINTCALNCMESYDMTGEFPEGLEEHINDIQATN